MTLGERLASWTRPMPALALLARPFTAKTAVGHVLKHMKARELERLLTTVLPSTYFERLAQLPDEEEFLGEEPPPQVEELERKVRALEQCFAQAFDIAPVFVRSKVAENSVRIVQEERGRNVLAYEKKLFRCIQLEYMSEAGKAVAKQHILWRLQRQSDDLPAILAMTRGIGPHLTEDEASIYANAVCRAITTHLFTGRRKLPETAPSNIGNEYDSMSPKSQQQVARYFDIHIRNAEPKGRTQVVEGLRAVESWWRAPEDEPATQDE